MLKKKTIKKRKKKLKVKIKKKKIINIIFLDTFALSHIL